MKKDLKWFSEQEFSSAEEMLDFMRRELPAAEQAIREGFAQAFAHAAENPGSTDPEIAFSVERASELLQTVIEEYLRRNPACSRIRMDFKEGAVPLLYDSSDESNEMLWFQMGNQPEWFDELPLKLDTELESFALDAESQGKQEAYMASLFSAVVKKLQSALAAHITVSGRTIMMER